MPTDQQHQKYDWNNISKTTQERPKNLTNMILVARQCDNKSDDAT